MNNINYKEFFDVTDYITVENLEFNYKKTVINSDNIMKQQDNSFVSFEKIEANTMLGIYKYLKYKSFLLEKEVSLLNGEKKNKEVKDNLNKKID